MARARLLLLLALACQSSKGTTRASSDGSPLPPGPDAPPVAPDAAGGAGGAGGGGGQTGGAGGQTGGADGQAPRDAITDAPVVSAGTVTLRLDVAPGAAYCHLKGLCTNPVHISIRDSSGRTLLTQLQFGICPAQCGSCMRPPCPGAPCLPPAGEMFTGEQLVWDGGKHEQGMCGLETCVHDRSFVRPGRFTAVMCATPGVVQPPTDAGPPTCRQTGELECVEVAFDFPTATPVQATLGGSSRDR